MHVWNDTIQPQLMFIVVVALLCLVIHVVGSGM